MAEYQTRNEEGATIQWESLAEALREAERDTTVWKISFNAEGGERIRLVMRTGYSMPVADEPAHYFPVWAYEPMDREIEDVLSRFVQEKYFPMGVGEKQGFDLIKKEFPESTMLNEIKIEETRRGT